MRELGEGQSLGVIAGAILAGQISAIVFPGRSGLRPGGSVFARSAATRQTGGALEGSPEGSQCFLELALLFELQPERIFSRRADGLSLGFRTGACFRRLGPIGGCYRVSWRRVILGLAGGSLRAAW